MKLLAVLLNYKTASMTFDALTALVGELAPYPDARVTVVDNDSQDGSFEWLSERVAEAPWRERVSVVASEYNGGFAYGNNFAIRRALASEDVPDYIYLLNSDAFPDPRGVSELVGFLDAHPETGIAGSFVHGAETSNVPGVHKTAFRFPSVASEFESTLGIGAVSKLLDRYIVSPPLPKETSAVDWLAGASMMIRREVIEDIGLMDEQFFLYFEETDYCLRARRAGWQIHYVVESSVTHIGSVSTGFQDLSRPTPTYWFFSRRHYFRKNHGRFTLWAANAAYILGGALCRARYRLIRRPGIHPRRHLRDFMRFNLRLGNFPEGRPEKPEGTKGEEIRRPATPGAPDVAR